ncbi:MAG: histidine phosphatase family protein [Deltaproteobacteria bacterium]|nr:MAG: histidine phosphatase family protein [Deltaproteobacteria bacterium]
MQRRLILMRHAKSERHGGAATDHARPLSKRGRRDAPRMAAWLVDHGWKPDAVVSSDATRTRQTWEHMAPWFEPDPPAVRFHNGLYLASLGALQRVSVDWAPAWGTVLALGHNPGWEQAVAHLSGVQEYMPTAACALLHGAGETWAEALEGRWRLERLLRPRELPQ